jgi:YbgC/YbaW family acyl-CoA thioester hydrolase
MTIVDEATPADRFVRAWTSVTWGDCDPAGVIFYPTVFAWMDRGAHVLFRELGVTWEASMPPAEALFPVVQAGAAFDAPARPDDELEVRTWVTKVGRSSFALGHGIIRPADGATIARGWERRVRVEQPSPGRFAPVGLDARFRGSLAARIVEMASDEGIPDGELLLAAE